MTATVEDNALLLEVLAGPDGLDPTPVRRPVPSRTGKCDRAKAPTGLRIAVVTRGLRPSATPKPSVRCAGEARRRRSFKRTWARPSKTVSIPMHLLGGAIWLPVAAEGATMQMMMGNGFGFNWQGPVRDVPAGRIIQQLARTAPTSCPTR